MGVRIAIAALVAGLVVFVWGFLSHTVLGLAPVKMLRAEGAVLGSLQSLVTEPGVYVFPGMDPHAQLTPEQKKAEEQRFLESYSTGPHGILVYTPPGSPLDFPGLLLRELASNVAGGLIAALLVAIALPGMPRFATRVTFVALLGLFASLAIDVSYWNWYGFPGGYTLAVMADQVIGWALAGVAIAALMKPARA